MNVKRLEELLLETKYNAEETKFLINGFQHGFDIGYMGPTDRSDTSNNIPFTVGDKFDMWDKIMEEVRLGRYAGPYEEPPFQNFIQSPIGLVPKSGGRTRLIFHLSYKFKNGNESVNFWIPKEKCSVKYNDLDHAVRNCLKISKDTTQGVFLARTDLMSAFRILPVSPQSWKWLILKACHPLTNKTFFFVDKNTPFRAGSSCANFQHFSCALRHITEVKAQRTDVITNYLDDYLFVDLTKKGCNRLVRTFLKICSQIKFPVAIEKTQWAERNTVFLGMLLLGESMQFSIPVDKYEKAVKLLTYFCDKSKATVKELQRLAGFLNFLNKAVVPGRTFTRRMYSKFAHLGFTNQKNHNQVMKGHYHVRVDHEFKSDCRVWLLFLKNLKMVCRPFVDVSITISATALDFFTDSSRNSRLGFGCVFGKEWTYGRWEQGYIKKFQPSIQYLELFAVCVGVFTWSHKLQNARFSVWCDNQTTCRAINTGSSSCKNCMFLLRMLALSNLTNNRRIFAKYIETKANGRSDALSRQQFRWFFDLSGSNVDRKPVGLPSELWPASKLWQL